MKKILIFVFVLAGLSAFSQVRRPVLNWGVTTAYITATDSISTANIRATGTLNVTGDFKVNTNKFVVTASSGNTTVAGTLGVTGTITLPGSTTLSKTTGNGNSATFNHSLAVTDTLVSPVINGSTKIYTPDLTATTTLTLPGATTITKTTGNVNSASFNHSVAVTDTLVAPTINATKIVIMTAGAGSDTTTKTAGKIVFVGGNFWGCDGTYYYKFSK